MPMPLASSVPLRLMLPRWMPPRWMPSCFVSIALCLAASTVHAVPDAAATGAAITVVEEAMEPRFVLRATVKRKDEKDKKSVAPRGMAPAAVLIGYRPGAPHLAVTLAADTLS